MGHMGYTQFEFEMWLPYYSFHLALFAFISGYFYSVNNDSHTIRFILKKARTILLPYFLISLFYLLLQTWLGNYGVSFGLKFSLYNWLVRPWIKCQPLGFNIATWFMISIFITEAIYVLSRAITKLVAKDERSRDILLLFIIGVGAITVISYSPYPEEWQRVWLRPIFLCLFCHLGYCYRRYFEGRVHLSYSMLFLVTLISRAILIKNFGKIDYGLWNCDFGGTPWWVVILTSIFGIGFWLSVAKIITPIVSKEGVLVQIGRHTREIMSHHLLAAFLWHGTIYLFHLLFALGEAFDINEWKAKLYFRYAPWGGGTA